MIGTLPCREGAAIAVDSLVGRVHRSIHTLFGLG
jgi:hypothetical protein